ncbi:MAG: protocatechuate 3,4-dioxygenase subunit alpha [Ilumatobacteraceae bacterium]
MPHQRLPITPSQTVGPYFTMALAGEGQNVVAGPDVPGTHVRIEGRVLDGDRTPIEDALVDLWQANAAGRYRHRLDARESISLDHGFTGHGSAATEFSTGAYWFETVKPGAVPDPSGGIQAPHLNLIVQARGMLMPSYTRLYFPEDTEAHEHDLVLSMVPADRRHTLIATLAAPSEGGDVPVYHFDIRFQGDDETVFFDL